MTENPNPNTNVVEGLVRQLYGLGAVQREISRHALAQLGGQGFRALAVVAVEGPQRVSAVAQHLGVDLSVASRQVAALVAEGYVERARDPEDGRAQIVALTPRGRRALRDSHKRMVAAFEAVLAGWSADEVAALSAGLGRLREDFLGLSGHEDTDENEKEMVG
jgi:DNA-binding MarR family transcriptional regulator